MLNEVLDLSTSLRMESITGHNFSHPKPAYIYLFLKIIILVYSDNMSNMLKFVDDSPLNKYKILWEKFSWIFLY